MVGITYPPDEPELCGVAVGFGVGVGVGVGVLSEVGDGVGVADGLGVRVEVGFGVALGVGDGVGSPSCEDSSGFSDTLSDDSTESSADSSLP